MKQSFAHQCARNTKIDTNPLSFVQKCYFVIRLHTWSLPSADGYKTIFKFGFIFLIFGFTFGEKKETEA